MRILIFVFLVLFSWQGMSQVVFYKLYSGNGYDRGEGIVQLEDSSYMITGSSSSWSGNADAFLLHLDSLGNYKWSSNYGGPESDYGRRVLYKPNLGYFVAGFSNSYSVDGNYDAYLLHTDLQGNKLWEKTYGTSNWEKINDAVFTSDSAILMVGETQPLNGESTNIFIVKTNFSGDTIWTKSFGSIGNDRANSIINIEDSLFVLGGEIFIPDSNVVKGFIIKMNNVGQIIWQDTVGDLGGEYGINDVFPGINKFYAVGKRKVSDTNHDDYFGSFDYSGTLVFQYTLNTPKNTMIDEVVMLPSINKTVIGTRLIDTQTYQDDFDNILAYCDTYYGYFDGNAGSYCVISNEGLDKCNQILPTNDGGYVAVGFNSNTGDNATTSNGGSNIYVAKISPGLPHPDPFAAISGNVNFGQLVLINENETNQDLVFPNPFNEFIQIQTASDEDQEFTLMNELGQIIQENLFQKQTQLDTSKIPSGLYILKVGTKSVKLIKQ